MFLKFFVILIGILCINGEFMISTINNCEICNNQTCIYNVTENSINLNNCVCNSTDLCGRWCKNRNISRSGYLKLYRKRCIL